MKNPLLSFFVLLFFFSSAQHPLVKQWDARFGGNKWDYILSFEQTNDGGFILGGYTVSDSTGDVSRAPQDSGDPLRDYWIVKTDSLGNKQWDKRYGGNGDDLLTSVQQTSDGGYILGGHTNSDSSGDVTHPNLYVLGYDCWLIKTDPQGNKLWDKRYGGIDDEGINALQQTSDGGYILGGTARDSGVDVSEPTRGNSDFWILKVDGLGNKQWDKRYGGSGTGLGMGFEAIYALQQTADGGYILGGTTTSDSSGEVTKPTRDLPLYAFGDYWIVKTDSVGNKQWDNRFGGINVEYLTSIRQANDGGYIIGGATESIDSTGDFSQPTRDQPSCNGMCGDYWVIKLDASGTKQWDKRLGSTENDDWFGYARQTQDNGYLFSGCSASWPGGEKSEHSPSIWNQTWVVKTDSMGIKQWDKTVFTLATAQEFTGYAIQTSDGNYAFANTTQADTGSYKTQMSRGGYDFWLIKFADTTFRCSSYTTTIQTNQPVFCASDSTLICAPFGFVSYAWNNLAGTSCMYTSNAGNYYVTVTDHNGCTAESNHLAVSVYPVSSVAVSVNGDTLTAYNTVTCQWYLNGTEVNGANDSIYVANQPGSYTVAVTDSNGCLATSSTVIISGIDNLTEHDVVSVYPNPLDVGFWMLECGSNLIGSTAEITDADGRIVYQSKIILPKSKIELNVSKGIYLLRISSSKSNVVRKLIRL